MLSLYDRKSMAEALAFDLDPLLKTILTDRIESLPADLIDYTAYLVIEPGDTEEMIEHEIGFTPLAEPIDSVRYGEPGFEPYWDWLGYHQGIYEMIVTFGGTFAYIMIVRDTAGTLPSLISMCRRYA